MCSLKTGTGNTGADHGTKDLSNDELKKKIAGIKSEIERMQTHQSGHEQADAGRQSLGEILERRTATFAGSPPLAKIKGQMIEATRQRQFPTQW